MSLVIATFGYERVDDTALQWQLDGIHASQTNIIIELFIKLVLLTF